MTLYHWFRASGVDEIFSDILQLSHFDAKGPVKVGERAGDRPVGHARHGGQRQGVVRQRSPAGRAALHPRRRLERTELPLPRAGRAESLGATNTFGVRLVKNARTAGARPPSRRTSRAIRSTVVPVSGRAVRGLIRGFYDYDRTPLDARVEAVDDGSPHWRKETVSFAAAYGSERIPAVSVHAEERDAAVPDGRVLPELRTRARSRRAQPRPRRRSSSSSAAGARCCIRCTRAPSNGCRRAGRAERQRATCTCSGRRTSAPVDYLETRPDIDKARLGYYSLSLGAFFGPIPVALEPRIKAAVFAAGGLRYNAPPEMQTANFMPRVTMPVLLVNGKDDFAVPRGSPPVPRAPRHAAPHKH